MPTTLQIRSKGTITLPAELRRKYNWEEGEILTAIDLGNGTLVLKSQPSKVMKSANKVARMVKEAGVSLDELLETLDEERKTYYQEHYVDPKDIP
jgi:AbrB family looped-hinge helix DNA binding protein